MAIALEKILEGISVRDYCENRNASISHYELVSVHISLYTRSLEMVEETIGKFAQKVPRGAEAVVEYNPHFISASESSSYHYYVASGIALIPKKNDNERLRMILIKKQLKNK